MSGFVVVDGACQGHEGLVDVEVGLHRGGEVLYLVRVAPLHDFTLADPAFQVALVTQQHYDCLVSFGTAEVVPLFLDVLEGLLGGQVEHHEYSVATLEVGGHDRSVLLLAGSIPDVQFGWLVFQIYVFYFEVDGGHLGVFFGQEIPFGEPPEESSFSDIAIPNDDDFVSLFIFVG